MATTTTLRRVLPACWSRWSAKEYILAALLGMLVTVSVAASISISLAPAHVSFSVRDASITERKVEKDGKLLTYWYYNLTLMANNTSIRTQVSYGSLSVDIWWSETVWVATEEVNTTASLPAWLLPGNTTLVKVGVEGGQYNEEETNNGAPPQPPSPPAGSSTVAMDSSSIAKWPNCRVVVEAKVRFRFARVPTLPYTVTVSCFPVNFKEGTTGPVNCTS